VSINYRVIVLRFTVLLRDLEALFTLRHDSCLSFFTYLLTYLLTLLLFLHFSTTVVEKLKLKKVNFEIYIADHQATTCI